MPRKKPTANPGVPIGPLGPNSTNARHFTPAPLDFEPPTKVCNSVMANMTQDEARRLTGGGAVRVGADQHKLYRSRGGF
jgi:hypothetical protein